MITKAIPLSEGMFAKNISSASKPPAEAPIPTMGKPPWGRRVISSASSVAWSGRIATSLFDRVLFGVLTDFFLLGILNSLSIQAGGNDQDNAYFNSNCFVISITSAKIFCRCDASNWFQPGRSKGNAKEV